MTYFTGPVYPEMERLCVPGPHPAATDYYETENVYLEYPSVVATLDLATLAVVETTITANLRESKAYSYQMLRQLDNLGIAAYSGQSTYVAAEIIEDEETPVGGVFSMAADGTVAASWVGDTGGLDVKPALWRGNPILAKPTEIVRFAPEPVEEP